jgi:hypothetical protein
MSDPLANLRAVQDLFPANFNVLEECLRHGVKRVGLEVRSLRPSPAMCLVDEAEISFDPTFFSVDGRQLAARGIFARTGATVDPAEVAVWAFYHEVAHLKRGPARAVRQPLFGRRSLMDSIFVSEEERACEEFAKWEFRKWKQRVKK